MQSMVVFFLREMYSMVVIYVHVIQTRENKNRTQITNRIKTTLGCDFSGIAKFRVQIIRF